MKVIQRQEFDDLLQFHESTWIQYCWVGCRPVERRWVEILSGVSLSCGWTSDRCGCSTVQLPESRSSCLPGIYLKHEQHDVFLVAWNLVITGWITYAQRCLTDLQQTSSWWERSGIQARPVQYHSLKVCCPHWWTARPVEPAYWGLLWAGIVLAMTLHLGNKRDF